MYRRTTFLLCIAWATLVPTGPVSAEPPTDAIGHWAFDEGSGSVAIDDSGNGNDGTVYGGAAWVPGLYDMALRFDRQDDYVGTDQGLLNNLDGFTMAGWISASSFNTYASIFGQNDLAEFGMTTESGGQIGTWMLGNDWAFLGADYPYTYPSWHHVVLAGDADRVVIYIDGQEKASDEGGMVGGTSSFLFSIGGNVFNASGDFFEGEIDDVWLYGRRLSQEEIQAVMAGPGGGELASVPSPADKAIDVPRNTMLTWTAGAFAVEHDVYLGTEPAAVEAASRETPMGVLASERQAATTFDPPEDLGFGQTYYWRVDEVNGAPDFAINKGNVWNFTVEPFAYPIQAVIATSDIASPENQGPENTVNGSGLNENDQHSTNTNHMWNVTPAEGETASIQFEFDRLYKLHEMLVWNYNMDFEWFAGIGFKDVTVEYSDNGTDWTLLGDVLFAQGTSKSTYTANTTVPFEGAPVRFVRLTANSSYGGTGVFGLSEVRFMYIAAQPREPQPADGAVNVDTETILSWRAGRGAITHEVYLGTDPDALALAGTSTQNRYDPGPLDLSQTYFWEIVEVNENEATPSWAGPVWSFSTQKYLEIDGFETYNDDVEAGTAVWQTWIDGLDDENNGGSVVGHDPSPFAELTIVHSGRQSMPLYYENTTASAISEADRTFAPAQDWTLSGIKSLSLWFYGVEGNDGRLYAKINNVKVPYNGAAGAIAEPRWHPWNIDLATVSTNLGSVRTLTIGVEGAGTGLVYIDDVRLYSKTAENVNLVGYFAFEDNTDDTSGSGNDGAANGDPAYGPGVDGQAISLDGVDDYVVVADAGVEPGSPRTISGWAKADTTDVTEWTGVFGFTGPAGNNGHFDIECVGDTDNTTLGYYGLHRYGWERDIIPIDLEWHHLAATYNGTTVSWYGDGELIGSEEIAASDISPPGAVHVGRRQDNTAYFSGSVDEIRIYDRALSAEELAGL